MPSSHLILRRPLLLLPPIPPSIRVFCNESTLRMRWPKYWSFSFNIIPSKEHPGLTSFSELHIPVEFWLYKWSSRVSHFYILPFNHTAILKSANTQEILLWSYLRKLLEIFLLCQVKYMLGITILGLKACVTGPGVHLLEFPPSQEGVGKESRDLDEMTSTLIMWATKHHLSFLISTRRKSSKQVNLQGLWEDCVSSSLDILFIGFWERVWNGIRRSHNRAKRLPWWSSG